VCIWVRGGPARENEYEQTVEWESLKCFCFRSVRSMLRGDVATPEDEILRSPRAFDFHAAGVMG
jgi:hypothetical protein